MSNSTQHPKPILRTFRALAQSALMVIGALALLGTAAEAQTLTVLHSFTGGADGANPYSPVTLDREGNLYGTASAGGHGAGVVYKLTHKNGNWTFATLYQFGEHNDAAVPIAGVVFGPDGSLYGTTLGGGTQDAGTVFNLRPPARFPPNIFAPWTETVLHSFGSGADGAGPYDSVTFDAAGNMYGTTSAGGSFGPGAVFELSPSGGGWTESVIYSFSGPSGAFPYSNVIFDRAGNLWGTTLQGGSDGRFGAIYGLTYLSGAGWSENFLYSFTDPTTGAEPYAGLTLNASGDLFGSAADGFGVYFEITPLNGTYSYSSLYGSGGGIEPCGAIGSLVIDAAGNLYGAANCDSGAAGGVFELRQTGLGWTYTTLYGFTGGSDGAYPQASVAMDANGNLYGTTTQGGAYGNGVVWELTP